MEYAVLKEDGSFDYQVGTYKDVVWGPNHKCPARNLTQEEAYLFRVVPLIEVEPPTINASTQKYVRDGAEKIGDDWFYKWVVVDLTAEEIEDNRKFSIPSSITMRQARLVLNSAGLLPAVVSAVNTSDEATKIEWEYASTLDRTWPTLNNLALVLGLTEVQIDNLFLEASTL